MARPLKDHRPLRFTKSDTEGKCPGNAHSFSILTGLALGHEISTDVVEVQPANLGNERAAWALASAMREALARRLGVESAELGVAVTPHETSVGRVTHSMFLYDRAARGAGFAPRLVDLFAEVLRDARTILDCRQPGCVRCCSSCVLASDLATRSDSMNRKAALQFLNSEFGKMSERSPEDVAAPGALLSIDVCDEVVAAATRGVSVVSWPDRDFDPAAMGAVRMRYNLSRLQANGASVAVCLEKLAIAGLDAAQKLALRD